MLGAVVITYNLQGVAEPLRFSPDVIADIFLGKIKRRDDARIKADNPGAQLPATNISVVHRSDGSGTTAAFTNYLAKVSPEWKTSPGAGKSVDWPVGIGGTGYEGVSGQIKQTPHTIGYAEPADAVQTKLPVALVKNKSGNFIARVAGSRPAGFRGRGHLVGGQGSSEDFGARPLRRAAAALVLMIADCGLRI